MTSYEVPDGPKMLRETLCAAQTAIGNSVYDEGRRREHVERLGRLIAECDRQRPVGPDGKHGDRHTPTCGCEDTAGPAAPQAWLVPKIRHDENVAVGPDIIGDWIFRAAGQSGVEHTRQYAAQLLAAADELERRQAADNRAHAGLGLPCDPCAGACQIDDPQAVNFTREFRAAATQLNRPETACEWVRLAAELAGRGVTLTAQDAVGWANLGFMPGEAEREIAAGVTLEAARIAARGRGRAGIWRDGRRVL